MARYHATIDTQQSPEEAFAYLSDFSTAQEWDPGVLEGERLTAGPIGAGTEFRLVTKFMGRTSPLTYQITEYEPPRAVTFLGENSAVRSRDRIGVERTDNGARVTYDAQLQPKGAFRAIDPLLQIAFNRTGDRALESLRELLARTRPVGLDFAA